MAKLFVFAIGGTGERVMRSLTMLMAAGLPTLTNYEVFPIIIDYDEKNADKNLTRDVLKNYAAAHDAAYTQHTAKSEEKSIGGLFFGSKLRNLHGLTDYVFPFKPATPNEQFREFIGFDKFKGVSDNDRGTLNTSDFLTSLYDKSNRPDTELNLDMTVGFKGNPNIGSVVFHTIGETTEFSAFNSLYNPDNGDKVVVIGSLFGGTGASGIPEIVKAIKEKRPNADIATILVLPYFSPMEEKDAAIKSVRFNSKTKAALSFYEASGLNDMISRRYYVGDFNPTVIKYSEGGTTQRNNANIVELIAAMMVEHYIANRDEGENEFKFSIDADIVVKPGTKSGTRLFYEQFDTSTKKNVLNDCVKLAIALKFFHEKIWSGKDKKKSYFGYLNLGKSIPNVGGEDINKSSMTRLCKAYEDFYHRYQEWLKELDFEGKGDNLPANSHRLALCDMTRTFFELIIKDTKVSTQAEKSGIIDTIKDGVDKLCGGTKEFEFDPQMNSHIKDDGKGGGHYDTKTNRLREGHEAEWVLADILHATAEDGFTELMRQSN